MSDGSGIVAGWYADADSGYERWWDGQGWTDHRRPSQAMQAPVAQQMQASGHSSTYVLPHSQTADTYAAQMAQAAAALGGQDIAGQTQVLPSDGYGMSDANGVPVNQAGWSPPTQVMNVGQVGQADYPGNVDYAAQPGATLEHVTKGDSRWFLWAGVGLIGLIALLFFGAVVTGGDDDTGVLDDSDPLDIGTVAVEDSSEDELPFRPEPETSVLDQNGDTAVAPEPVAEPATTVTTAATTTTVPPTTVAPTTVAPTTAAPATEAPTTEALATTAVAETSEVSETSQNSESSESTPEP